MQFSTSYWKNYVEKSISQGLDEQKFYINHKLYMDSFYNSYVLCVESVNWVFFWNYAKLQRRTGILQRHEKKYKEK